MIETILELQRFVYGGTVLGRPVGSEAKPGGRAVFVPFGLPGERVRVRLIEQKSGFARARLLEVLQASPERITPRCPHFGECGGCHYQHLPYQAQLEAKEAILRDQLQRLGKIGNPPLEPMQACAQPWNYRNHVQFHLIADGQLGYVRSGAEGGRAAPGDRDVLPIRECHLPEAPLDKLWRELEFEALASGERDPEITRVALRTGLEDVMLVLEARRPHPPEMGLQAGISVVHLFQGDALVMAGQDHLIMSALGREFRVSAASFFQVNTRMAERMVELLLEALPASIELLLDLYCGVGLFSAFLAPRCQRLVAVESSPSACDDYAHNLDEFDHVVLFQGATAEVLPGLPDVIGRPSKAGIVAIVDPPRSGLDRKTLDALVALAPVRLAYVSCDPATLARDAARLIGKGYRLASITPIDLFPQTYHIESLSLFER